MHKKLPFFALLTVFALALVAGGYTLQSNQAKEAARLNNLGVAYMNQQQLEKALEKFQAALAQDESLTTARLNKAIALFNLQRFDQATPILLEVLEADPANLRARYNLGLLYKSRGQSREALAAFQKILQEDPRDADSHYFAGLMLNQLREYEEAIKAFNRALELNNFHVSAEFGLARAYQRSRNLAEARNHLKRFQYITQRKLGAPISLAYGEQGPYSLAELSPAAPIAPPPAIDVRFTVATEEAGIGFVDPQGNFSLFSPGACFLDYDKDGNWDLLLINSNGPSALYRNLGGGKFEDTTQATALKASGRGVGCAAADYDNDGRADLAIGFQDRVVLYRNQADGTFADTDALQTKAAGTRAGVPISLTFVDYDHDGDADLFVNSVRSRAKKGMEAAPATSHGTLYRNNGNKTFTIVSPATGLTGDGSTFTALASDFNNDRAVDFLLPWTPNNPTAFFNPREGKFRAQTLLQEALPSLPLGAALLDFDQDGWMDIALTHRGEPGLTLWRNVDGESIEPVPLPDLGWFIGWGVAAVDYDNDGWLDLAAAGITKEGAELRLLRNLGPEGFSDATKKVALDKITVENARALITADYDQDGDTDLLLTQNGGAPLLLRNDGGNKNHSIRIALTGLADNKSAIGAKVEVFAGALRQKWEVQAASGFLGQSALEIVAGLGQAQEADIVRILWPTGVLQDEIEMAAERHAITEVDRRGSSCPILFGWNGERYAMISDAIGPGLIGHRIAPGMFNSSDPTEYIKIDGDAVKPRGGRLSFRFTEPLEEIVYLDQIRLMAVDHPEDTELYPHEYFALMAPKAPVELIVSRDAHPPLIAVDDKGRDVLPDLLHLDRKYVDSFKPLPYSGFAELHTLEMDIGEWNPERPLRLLLHGFIDYFNGRSIYAAEQSGTHLVPTRLEAWDNGKWVTVINGFGFPAGMPRAMVTDLTGKLPAGTQRIRIVTNLKIYWDQILVDNSPEGLPLKKREVSLVESNLRYLGYPNYEEHLPPSNWNVTYFYEDSSQTGPYKPFAGPFTRYGDVKPLLAEADDRFVILGPGDETTLEFDSTELAPVQPGWKRDYILFGFGYVKDMSFYEAHPLTVEPLPFRAMSGYPYTDQESYPLDELHLEYLLDYNTRHESGRTNSRYRYDFPKKK